MANSTTERSKTATGETVGAMAVLAPALGWLIPGAGHMIQKRWIRGALLFISIVTLFLLGLAMQGRIYRANGGDILDMLGFVGNIGAGALYLLALTNDWGQGAIAFATADYGTKFMIVAGLLNFIAVADAYHIAIGKNNDRHSQPFQRGGGLCPLRVRRLRHYPPGHNPRDDSLRVVLLCHVSRGSAGCRMGHVAAEKVVQPHVGLWTFSSIF